MSTSYASWLADHSAGATLFWSAFLAALVGLMVGIWLLARAAPRRLVNLGLVAFGVGSTVLVGEVVARVYYRLAYNINVLVPMRVRIDDALGWQGERVFGDPHTRRPKVFVIGDSFTEGSGIPPASRYYSVLGRVLGMEVFAYGAGGYGTLQEYLVLDRYLGEINPDIVLLQVHSNDFINNSWELERASYFNNNMTVRPYLIGDAIDYRFPSRLGGLRLFLAANSRLFYEAIIDADRLAADLARRGYLHSVERDILAHGLAFGPFRESMGITNGLIARMKIRLGTTALAAFSADRTAVFFDQWRRIFAEHGIPFCESLPVRIREGEIAGATLRLADGAHWNVDGHDVAGRSLAEWLLKQWPAQ